MYEQQGIYILLKTNASRFSSELQLFVSLENNWSRFKNCNCEIVKIYRQIVETVFTVFFLTSFFRLTKHMAHRLAKCPYSKIDVPIVEVYTVTSVSQSLKVVEHCCGGTVPCEFFGSLGFMIVHKVSMIHKQQRRFGWMKTITFSYPQESSYYNCQFSFIVHLGNILTPIFKLFDFFNHWLMVLDTLFKHRR